MSFSFQRNYRGSLQAVLLDWAGTTMDYGCYAPAVVFIEVFKKHGVEITMEQARAPMGTHKRVHLQEVSRIPAVSKKWQDVHGSAITEQDIDKIYEAFIPMQIACLAKYSDLIPGTLEAISNFRERGLKIGSTTGYTGPMMEILQHEAKERGYVPDCTVCATDVPFARPEPWMCIQNAMNLRIFPFEAIVKVGDTIPDITEGLNAGMWTIGLAKTGNEIGLNESEIKALPSQEYEYLLKRAYSRLQSAGAHYTVDSIAEVPPILDLINERLSRGERP